MTLSLLSPARALPLALAFGLSLAPASAQSLGPIGDEDRATLREEIRAYLLEHPEVLIEALEELQGRESRAADQRLSAAMAEHREDILNSPGDWAGHALEGDVTMVEFMDYYCGYCRRAVASTDAVLAGDDNLRFVIKELPVLGEESVLAAQFAISVLQLHGADAYKVAHDRLMRSEGKLSREALLDLGVELGHDKDAIAARMGGAEVQAVLDRNYALAQELGINGTPAFVIEDILAPGALDPDELNALVSEVRIRKAEGAQ